MAGDVSLSTGTSNLLSGSVKWSGISSGIDFASVVDQLVELERTNITRQEAWKATWEEKITSIQGLNTRMASLRDHADDFNSYEDFFVRNSTSSNTAAVTVTNTATAATGSHSVTVGADIPGKVASRSYDSTIAVGGAAGATLTITVGSSTVTLVEGVDYNSTDTIDQLAAAINAADAAGSDILEDVVTVTDKDRSGTIYKRLVITAKSGGTANAVSVSDPTGLNMDINSIDSPHSGSSWLGSSTVSSGGTYLGSTNKTFTFRIASTGNVGTDSILIEWADNEGNSGKVTVDAAATSFDVFQGVTISLSAGTVFKDDSFTIDAYNPTLQAAQDSGLAQVEQRVHDGFRDLITPVTSTAGEFVYRYEGVETSVSIDPKTTLQGLASAINNDPNNRGVVATIINDGQNTSTSYHLVLTGKHTGAEHSISIVSDSLDNFTASESTFETAQKASNAMIKVDGYPSDASGYIQRSSNTVSDILEDISLELKGTGSSTVTVSNDIAAIQKNIEALVNSINFVQDYIRQETEYDRDTKTSGVMLGNYTYDIVKTEINRILAESVPGLSRDTDVYSHLSQIGIKTDPDQNGRWIVESTTLRKALNNDLEAVAKLFVSDEDNDVLGVGQRLYSKLDEYTDSETGIANVLIDNYRGIIKDIDSKIEREERRVKLVKERLELQFSRLETLLSELNGQSDALAQQISQLPKMNKD